MLKKLSTMAVAFALALSAGAADLFVNGKVTAEIVIPSKALSIEQEAAADLAEMLHPHYDLACYTGYTWEGLLGYARRRPDVLRLLHNIDILVDGPFVRAKRDPLLLFRGSSNQRILDVKASLANGAATWTKDPNWIGTDGSARAETY